MADKREQEEDYVDSSDLENDVVVHHTYMLGGLTLDDFEKLILADGPEARELQKEALDAWIAEEMEDLDEYQASLEKNQTKSTEETLTEEVIHEKKDSEKVPDVQTENDETISDNSNVEDDDTKA